MTSQAAAHQRNIESAILFMQQEHAKTLKGLHDEISKLQSRCKELTFQLNMQGLDVGTDGISADRFKHMENLIDNQRETQHELEQELEKKDNLIQDIENNFKRQKMKHLEEMRQKTKEIDHLRAENEVKSNTIAYMTTELHKLKRLQLNVPQNTAEKSAFMPAPPKGNPSRPRRSQHLKRSIEEELKPVQTNSGKSSGSSRSESPSELVRPFLHQDDLEPEIHIKTAPEPLPPIRTSSGRVIRPQVDVVHVKMHTVTKPSAKLQKGTSGSTSQEIETLAIGNVSHTEPKWTHHAHESRSTEYH
ncbi:hypothetical protein ACJMK2_011559 [Sinanodonta woodiana]|uniref:CCDC92/74 N-terminal domain-containing protein n=1 Tax=Sinanodonta woodiana TaxID=1069815 RepID=A0ABD3V7S4_SINWO